MEHRQRRGCCLGRLAMFILILGLLVGIAARLVTAQAPMQKGSAEKESSDHEVTAEALSQIDAAARRDGFYTILLTGVDDGNGGSDTNILIAFDSVSGAIHGVSIPRDCKAIIGGKSHKINAAYNIGGTELLRSVISEQLGIPIDYGVEVSLGGFEALVDAIGGVDFDVPVDMDYEDPYQDLYIHIPAGEQHLNGEQALKVVRFRAGYASQDIGRMETQQAFLKAAAKELLKPQNVLKAGELAKIFRENVTTDLSAGNIAWLAAKAAEIGTDGIDFTTLPGSWHSPYIYLDQSETLTLLNERFNPYTYELTEEDLAIPGR